MGHYLLWAKKRKGMAIIHTHPATERAVVQDPYGIRWNGEFYETLDAAKQAALAPAKTEGERIENLEGQIDKDMDFTPI